MTDFTATRARFRIPEGVIYLDGNSLGPLPRAVPERVQAAIEAQWGEQLIRAWNTAGWMQLPGRVGDAIGRLVGAAPGSVTLGDTLSVKLFQAVASALELRRGRTVVLSDSGNFPSDLYIAGGLLDALGRGHELKVVAPEDVASQLDESVGLLMLTHVDYRTGRMHDMEALTRKAHEVGALVCWDLAHSAGAVPVDLAGADADFAVGCTYKYLNGGPGAPGFVYVAPRLVEECSPILAGWLGHAEPFAFELDYRPAPGIERMRVGTPPVLGLAALEAALEAWEGVEMAEVRARSIELSDAFLVGVEGSCPQLKLASPRDPAHRGSQLSFAFEHAYAVVQALIDRGVIGDFRAPDLMRFGFTPLYLGLEEVERAVELLAEVMRDGLWDEPRYHQRALVT